MRSRDQSQAPQGPPQKKPQLLWQSRLSPHLDEPSSDFPCVRPVRLFLDGSWSLSCLGAAPGELLQRSLDFASSWNGPTFHSPLRSALRHDSDIICIGSKRSITCQCCMHTSCSDFEIASGSWIAGLHDLDTLDSQPSSSLGTSYTSNTESTSCYSGAFWKPAQDQLFSCLPRDSRRTANVHIRSLPWHACHILSLRTIESSLPERDPQDPK